MLYCGGSGADIRCLLWCELDEMDERHLDKIYLRLGEMREKEHCTRVIQFPIPLQYKQGMKPRDTNNTDRIFFARSPITSYDFLRYEYMAHRYCFCFQIAPALFLKTF